jgi:hypothetical protein
LHHEGKGVHPIGWITPTLTLPRQGGGKYLVTLINPPSPGGRGLGGGGKESLNLGNNLFVTFVVNSLSVGDCYGLI